MCAGTEEGRGKGGTPKGRIPVYLVLGHRVKNHMTVIWNQMKRYPDRNGPYKKIRWIHLYICILERRTLARLFL